MPENTTPGDFKSVFAQGVPIVGGHAVNVWATVYAARGDTELASFRPFTSKDGDIFITDPDLAKATAVAAGWKFEQNPEPRSPVLGRMLAQREGQTLVIHVMRSVTGLSDVDLSKTEALRLEDGSTYCVPAPDIMLKAKLNNLASIDQSERQDERHVRILIPCCRHYLLDTFEAVRSGDLPEREAVDRFMEIIRLLRSDLAQRMENRHTLNMGAAIPPETELRELSSWLKLKAFYDFQLKPPGAGQRL